MTEVEKRRLRHQVSSAFSPSAPVSVERLFAGRRAQLQKLLDAVPMRGQHAIVYGERGVGKTSLARILSAYLSVTTDASVTTPFTSCDSTDTFDSVWRKVFGDLVVTSESQIGSVAPPTESTAADNLPNVLLTPEWIRRYMDHWGQNTTLVVIIDEFDCFPNNGERRLFAETLKLLSDRSTPATIVLVGVADDISSLLEEHSSIERALVTVPMPRMSRLELQEIINKALASVQIGTTKMDIDQEASKAITMLSQGLPHYTHLLGLEAAKCAIESDSLVINQEHVLPAIRAAVDSATAMIKDSYYKATVSPRKDNLYGTVLLACAIAQGDEQGNFTAADVRQPMGRITGTRMDIPSYSRHLHDFCEIGRGAVLHRIGIKHAYRFRFANPLLQPYVILKGIKDGKVPESALEA